jgi:hypothetical protein
VYAVKSECIPAYAVSNSECMPAYAVSNSECIPAHAKVDINTLLTNSFSLDLLAEVYKVIRL